MSEALAAAIREVQHPTGSVPPESHSRCANGAPLLPPPLENGGSGARAIAEMLPGGPPSYRPASDSTRPPLPSPTSYFVVRRRLTSESVPLERSSRLPSRAVDSPRRSLRLASSLPPAPELRRAPRASSAPLSMIAVSSASLIPEPPAAPKPPPLAASLALTTLILALTAFATALVTCAIWRLVGVG